MNIESRHTLVNIPWLTAYLLLVSVEGKATRDSDPARRAGELLQLLTSLPSSGLEAPCVGGSMVIGAHGVSASIDHDGFITAMARACEEANCRSPVPGPSDKVTTWVILARLAWGPDQMVNRPQPHYLLEVIREWFTWL